MAQPSEAAPRVFISYSHADGKTLAQRLRTDLNGKGFETWLDTQRLSGGDLWSNEIESAIDDADIVVALLSDGSYVSEVCRGEQLRSLRKGKCVIPLKVQKECDVPVYLEARQWLDFSSPKSYDQDHLKLLAAMEKRKGAVLKPEYRTTYNNAPGLLENLVRRPETLAGLRKQLFAQGMNRNIALTALRGMGGIGKTVLAQELCHDDVVQQAFPDGIFWFTIGQETKLDFVSRVQQVPALDRLLGEYLGEEACKSQYRDVLRKKAALIVLDDVWSATDVRPFYAESPRSRLLFTTRDASIAASFAAGEFQAELLTEDQSREVLKRWSGWQGEALPAEATGIIHECGRLPLALSMIGASLHGEPSPSWNGVADRLRHADLSLIEGDVGAYQHISFLRAIQVSLEALESKGPRDKEHYLALAVLLEEMEAPVEILSALWGLDDFETRRVAKRLVDLSMAQRETPESGLKLHDLQLDNLRKQYVDQEALSLILEAMRLSLHVFNKDPSQFASQLTGRLISFQGNPTIARFLARIADGTRTVWLRPLHPSLHPPGTPLLRTLTGHTDEVNDAAVTLDGRRAISASDDKTLKLWDLETGAELRTLFGHTSIVTAVAVTPDGRRAISASEDRTLKLWDLETGAEVRTLYGHTREVRDVAVTPDGRRAVSASGHTTLKVWDLETGAEVRTHSGHFGWGGAVAVTPDGRRILSARWQIKLSDLESGVDLRTLSGHTGNLIGEGDAVAVTPDGRRAIFASDDYTLKLWDIETDAELRTLSGHTYEVNAVAVTPDGRRAISASSDQTLKLWDLQTVVNGRTLSGHSSTVIAVAVIPNSRRAISASDDAGLKLWDLETGTELRHLFGHFRSGKGFAVTPDGRCIITASDDHRLTLWDLETGAELRILSGHSKAVNAVAVTPDGRRALSASSDETIKVWDLESGAELRTLSGHTWTVNAVAVTPDGRRALSASDDQTLGLWDLETGAELRTLSGHTSAVKAVAITQDGRRAISASNHQTPTSRDLEDGGDEVCVDSYRIPVSASNDRTLRLWDLESGAEMRTLSGHLTGVNAVAVNPDGRRFLLVSEDRRLRLWDLESGRQLATFNCDAPASCCAFSSTNEIIAGDAAGRIHFLHIEEPRPER
jgi:WD40 repeat protein